MIPRLRPPFSLCELIRGFASQARTSEAALERELAERFGVPAALVFPYGRFALYCLLNALGWSGRRIAIPAYTCVVVPHAVVLAGNRVAFVDCEAGHFNVSAHRLAAATRQSPDMVVATPVFGYPVDRVGYNESLRHGCSRPFVLFDAAHAFGIEDAAGLQFSEADAVLLGLGIGKTLSTLNGGVLLLQDEALCQAVREYRDRVLAPPERFRSLKCLLYGLAVSVAFREPALRVVDYLERNTKLLYRCTDYYYGKQGPSLPADAWIRSTAFQAQLGRLQLRRYDSLCAQRRQLAQWYEKRLSANGFRLFDWHVRPTYSHFPLAVGEREKVREAMWQRGVQLGTLIDYACPDLPGYEEHAGTCPNASWFAAHMVNLPNWPGMSKRTVDFVVDSVLRLRDRFPGWFLPDAPAGTLWQTDTPRKAVA